MIYLAIIAEISFEYVLDICWVHSVNLVPKRAEKPVCPVLSSKVSHIVVQPMEVEELVK